MSLYPIRYICTGCDKPFARHVRRPELGCTCPVDLDAHVQDYHRHLEHVAMAPLMRAAFERFRERGWL